MRQSRKQVRNFTEDKGAIASQDRAKVAIHTSMEIVESPKANPDNLLRIIEDARRAKVVIPDFQRSFVWERDGIQDLLTSILRGYFMGMFLMLDTPSENAMFPFRPVEGVKIQSHRQATVRLVLDGQQRITSLFYALYEPDIPLQRAKYPHRFYLRLESILENDLESAVVGVSERDTTHKAELDQLVDTHKALPFSRLRDSSSFNKWLYKEQSIWREEELKVFEKFHERLQKFMVPVISFAPETSEEDIVNIFERINRTGVSLSLFDLAVAKLYRNGIRLRELWETARENHLSIKEAIVKPEFLLRLIALLQGKEPRKSSLLKMVGEMEAKNFETLWNEAVRAIVQAHQRITSVSGYGAFDQRWIPYTTLIVPLAALLHKIETTSVGAEAYRKLDCWYWGSVLSQRYDNAVETKSYKDFREIGSWLENQGSAPEWLQRISTQTLNIKPEKSRSTLYRGLMGLIARQGSKDFLTGQPADLNKCQDDHIFPKSVYGQTDSVDSLLNRTLISKTTNAEKKNKLPSEFLKECLEQHGKNEAKLLETLRSHFISEAAYQSLKKENVESFVNQRHEALERAVQDLLSPANL